MRIIKYFILFSIFIIFEFIMFSISLEIGLSSIVLISTIFTIWIILKKITTIVKYGDSGNNEDSFKNFNNLNSNISNFSETQSSKSNKLFAGFDGSIFEKFKKNLNLNSKDIYSSKISIPEKNLQKEDLDNYELVNENNVFNDELNEREQVRVTLSKKAKSLNESRENLSNNENTLNREINKISDNNKPQDRSIGSGEEALKILTSKQKALREQSEKTPVIDLIDYEDDLFEDELIPIPGGENFSELKEENYKSNNKGNLGDTSFQDEEFLENTFSKDQTESEKKSEAESLLRLATSSCEAGKIEEAKISLKIYFDLMTELNEEPTLDVKKLSDKLNISYDTKRLNLINKRNDLDKSTKNQNEELVFQEIPEQANYANVMDGLVRSLEEKDAYEEALPLLKDLLEYNRKRGNISDMDSLFDRLEQAYSSLKNDEKLYKAYKEHLLIKQQLGDLEGELNLLDLISYYYANMGDQEALKRYQAESKRVKHLIEEKMITEKNL